MSLTPCNAVADHQGATDPRLKTPAIVCTVPFCAVHCGPTVVCYCDYKECEECQNCTMKSMIRYNHNLPLLNNFMSTFQINATYRSFQVQVSSAQLTLMSLFHYACKGQSVRHAL